MIGVTGYGSKIIEALAAQLPDEEIIVVERPFRGAPTWQLPAADRFVLASGAMRDDWQDPAAMAEMFKANAYDPITIADRILRYRPEARICIIGSASASRGSGNVAYAASKSAVHGFVETRKVGPRQQLCAVAPHIISDAGMTTRRDDYLEVMERGRGAPRGRWINSAEVAGAVIWLLYSDSGFWVNNRVISLEGGRS